MSLPLDFVLPETAPFNPDQRAWLNGYLVGLSSAHRLFLNSETKPSGKSSSADKPLAPLLILFGSQTGTAENLALRYASEASRAGFKARAVSMNDFTSADLSKEPFVAVISSTYGEGEFPDNAQSFWNSLVHAEAPNLAPVGFSVLSLGDTNYTHFCKAGKEFDRKLEQLGARRLTPRVDCDVDFEEPANAWFKSLLSVLGEQTVTGGQATGTGGHPVASHGSSLGSGSVPGNSVSSGNPTTTIFAPGQAAYSKVNPYPARLKTNRLLSGAGSAKETRHFEIVLGDSGLNYSVGDALGVIPSNCPELVTEIIQGAGLTGDELVLSPSGREKPLHDVLQTEMDLRLYLHQRPSAPMTAAELVKSLRKLNPRLYSISSSPKAHPGEVHLTIGIVRYDLHGRSHKGVCSTFLAERVTAETPVPVFIHSAPGFKPPADAARPMIMVGPGTGIAPFRAFLEERYASGASGKNWLFFGDQRQATDYLYREELEGWQKTGFLTRLELAFSRDQSEKVYVQNRMVEHAQELWSWLEEGAHFYVCGDASRMAKDVDAALHHVCQQGGGLSPENAAAYVQNLKSEKRYCRDVY